MMRPAFKISSAFTRTKVLLLIAGLLGVVEVLAWMCLPKKSMSSPLSNARQFQIATQMMTLDTLNTKGDGMVWTSRRVNGTIQPASLAAYFYALVTDNYLSREDLRKLLTAPGKRPGGDTFPAEEIAFKFFAIDEDSPPDQPFAVTANWAPTGLMDEPPYGKKGFVMFTKNGSGGIYNRASDATSPDLFPVGPRYRYELLR